MFAGKMFAVNFFLREFIFADRWKIAKITTSKNFVPHGTSQTVLIRDIDNTWSFFKKSIVGLVWQVRLSACKLRTSLENQKKRDNEIFPWLIFVCVFQSLFFLGKCCSYSSWQKELKQSYCVSRFSHHQEHGLLVIMHFKKNKKGLTLLKE